jgi:hypothetical protein
MRLMDDQGDFLTVIGTHLDHRYGRLRHKEMKQLLHELFCGQRQHNANPQEEQGADDCCSNYYNDDSILDVGVDTRIILAGDLNQQRQMDYPREEWESVIAPNMKYREVCLDDGVDSLLQAEGFSCAWDKNAAAAAAGQDKASSPTTIKNWTTEHPPSTHWSNAVFISPAGWSDHRMTVVDWTW